MASSLDQVGPVARTVLDTALLHEAIAGHDPPRRNLPCPMSPATSLKKPRQAQKPHARATCPACASASSKELGGGDGEGFEAGVPARFRESVEELRAAGAEIIEVSCPPSPKPSAPTT